MSIKKLFVSLIYFFTVSTFSGVAMAQYTLAPSNNAIIDRITQKYIGSQLSLSELDKIMKEISQDGLYQVLYLEEIGDNKVKIKAQETYKISNITVTGNSSYKYNDVLEKTKIKVGQTLSQIEINQAIDRLRNYYRNSGFYNFNITHEIKNSDDQTFLQINIDENKYCLIDDIRFFSNNEKLNNELNLLSISFLKANYTQNTIADIEKLILEYLDQNRFLIAKISNILAAD